jgi:hypothetical protein
MGSRNRHKRQLTGSPQGDMSVLPGKKMKKETKLMSTRDGE